MTIRQGSHRREKQKKTHEFIKPIWNQRQLQWKSQGEKLQNGFALNILGTESQHCALDCTLSFE